MGTITIPEHRRAAQAELEQKRKEYLAKGGKIKYLKSVQAEWIRKPVKIRRSQINEPE